MVAEKKERMGRKRPIMHLDLYWVWSGIVADGKVVVFVKEFVVSIAHVSLAVRAELCCALRASGLSFHSFLAGNSEAADVSDFNLFTGLEISAKSRRSDRGGSRGCDSPSCSDPPSFGFCLGLCFWF
jgi:hypothetical protein